MFNAGKYRHRIKVFEVVEGRDQRGFPTKTRTLVAEPYAYVKTTSGYTLVKNGTDFEKAYTNFTIRFPQSVVFNRDMEIDWHGKTYTIAYLNDIDGMGVELEIQAQEVTH